MNYPFAKDKWASGFTDLCFVAKVLFDLLQQTLLGVHGIRNEYFGQRQ